MFKNNIKPSNMFKLITFVLFICFGFTMSTFSAVTFGGTQTLTVSNKTCYVNTSSVSYLANVINITSPPTGQYVCGTNYTINLTSTKFELRYGTLATSPLKATKYGTDGTSSCVAGGLSGNNLSGSFDMTDLTTYPAGVYTIFATIYVNDITEGRSKIVNINTTFTIGYQAVWANMIDFQATPNSYSLKRNVATGGQTYAGARSTNILPIASSGFIDLDPQITSTATTGSVYIVIGKTTSTTTFNPNATGVTYIEYRKTGASTASVYLRNGVTNTTSIALGSMTISSGIRIVKTGTTLKFYYANTNNQITNATDVTGFNLPINVGVFASNVNDGVKDVVTSFICSFENQFYYLNDEVNENIAYVNDTELKFKFEEDYFDLNGLLNYKITSLATNTIYTSSTVSKPNHTNWIKLDLGTAGLNLPTGVVYLLEVKDVNGNKKFLKFKLQA